jgi:hypothetical protein
LIRRVFIRSSLGRALLIDFKAAVLAPLLSMFIFIGLPLKRIAFLKNILADLDKDN